MASFFVPEASDRANKFYVEPKRLLEFCPFIKQLAMWEIEP